MADAGSCSLMKPGVLSRCFVFSRILTFENESFNILEGIHVIIFPFPIASGCISDAPSSDKLSHTDVRDDQAYKESN